MQLCEMSFVIKGGAHVHDDKLSVTAPTAMWIKALDIGLEKLSQEGFDFSSVSAISGTGQVCTIMHDLCLQVQIDFVIYFQLIITIHRPLKLFSKYIIC